MTCPQALRRSSYGLACIIALLGACTSPSASPEKTPPPQARFTSSELTSNRLSKVDAAALQNRLTNPNWQVLDSTSDGQSIAGSLRQTLPNTTMIQRFHAHYADPNGIDRPVPGSRPLQDARFSPDTSLVALLDDQGELSLWNPQTDARQILDNSVFPSFAWSSDSKSIAYAKGDAPFLQGWIRDLSQPSATAITETGYSVWGFAFSPDSTHLAFVHTKQGFPSLYTLSRSDLKPVLYTNRGRTASMLKNGSKLAPFPDGRRPPLWLSESILVVEDQDGVHAIDKSGSVIWEKLGAWGLRSGSSPSLFQLFHDGKAFQVRLAGAL